MLYIDSTTPTLLQKKNSSKERQDTLGKIIINQRNGNSLIQESLYNLLNLKRYLGFNEDIETLKEAAGLTCNCAELDAYLWVAGEYWYWKAHPRTNINGDLKPHFERLAKDPDSEGTLALLLGIGVSAENAVAMPV